MMSCTFHISVDMNENRTKTEYYFIKSLLGSSQGYYFFDSSLCLPCPPGSHVPEYVAVLLYTSANYNLNTVLF